MANRRHFILTLALPLLLTAIAALPSYAQDEKQPGSDESSTYYIEQTESGAVFHQKLAWKKEKYVLRYVISIQHRITNEADTQKIHDFVSSLNAEDRTLTAAEDAAETDSGWEQVLNYATTSTSIEVSLPSGSYRYCIHVYNLLEKLAGSSGWIPLEIHKALQPEITAVTPGIVYLEDDIPTTFTLTGTALLNETAFSFANQKDRNLLLTNPVVSEDNTSATLTINPDVIDTGTYTFGALNPGGLSTSACFTVRFQKKVDTEVSLGYRPAFVLYDNTFSTYFGTFFFANTADARFIFIPLKRKLGYFGLSLHPQLFIISRTTPGFSLHARMWTCSLDFVYQRPIIKRKLYLDAHAGPAVLFIDDLSFSFPNSVRTEGFYSWYLGIEAGAGVQYYFLKRIYVEGSCEFQTAFFPDMKLGYLLPGIRFGYQF